MKKSFIFLEKYTIHSRYAIARAFKTPTQIEGKYSKPMKNIIIYVGDADARNYREMLQLLTFNTRIYNSDLETQCLR
jgi:hypothetical protein